MKVRRPSPDDLSDVLGLVQAADIAVVGESDWTEDDLRAEWKQLDLDENAWLVDLDGRLAGYATFEDRGGGRLMGDGYVHPELRGRGVGGELLRLTEERALRELPRLGAEQRVYLQSAALLEQGTATSELYAAKGYVPVRHFYRLTIDLSGAEPPAPRLPPAIGLETFEPARDAQAVHAAYQEAFAEHWEHREESWEEWEEKRVGDDRFDPTLWLVARDGDEVAGFALNYWKTEGDSGYVQALGVRPAWRRRGLGEALLRASFGEFHRRGERRVTLGVDAQNPSGATRLYERVGMHVLWRASVYEKVLRPSG